MLAYILLVCSIGYISCSQAEPVPRVSGLYHAEYNECEGRDANNYTLWLEISTNQEGNEYVIEDSQLIQCSTHGDRAVNSLKKLSSSDYPSGAYTQFEALWLITGGPLQGKYLYEKVILLAKQYLKRFSSVLGYSYVTTKSASLLINDRLDLSVLISPTGAYEQFRKGCSTICRGSGYMLA